MGGQDLEGALEAAGGTGKALKTSAAAMGEALCGSYCAAAGVVFEAPDVVSAKMSAQQEEAAKAAAAADKRAKREKRKADKAAAAAEAAARVAAQAEEELEANGGQGDEL